MDLLTIAHRFDVRVEHLPAIPREFTLCPDTPFGCDPVRNVMFIREDHRGQEDKDPDTFLHELVHVLVTPPPTSMRVGSGKITANISTIHEGWILLPFERLLAQETLPPEGYAAVVDYQEATSLDIFEEGRHLMDLYSAGPNPERLPFWQEAIARAQLVGLLDDQCRVTWKRADWSCGLDTLDLPDWLI